MGLAVEFHFDYQYLIALALKQESTGCGKKLVPLSYTEVLCVLSIMNTCFEIFEQRCSVVRQIMDGRI